MEVLACAKEGAWLQMVLQEAAASCSSGHQAAVASALISEAEMSVTVVEAGWVGAAYLSSSVEPLEVAAAE